MTIDQIERDMEIANSDLKNVSGRFYKLGYEKAKLEEKQAQIMRRETTKMIPAQDWEFENYRKSFLILDDDLHFWCEKCEKPLTGHWAMPKWWNFCPWCGRQFVATSEAWDAMHERRWEGRRSEQV